MNYRIILTLVLAALATTAALADEPNVKKYEIGVGDFTTLKVKEGVPVEYRSSVDSVGFARFTTTPDKAALVTFSSNKETLTIALATDGAGQTGIPLVTVYSRFLTKVENSGDSLVRVARVEPTPSFRVRLVGNGQISVRNIETNYLDTSLDTGNGVIAITGKTTKAKYSLTGVGSIQADEVVADEVKCSLLGTGYVECSAASSLTVTGASSGKVYYKGAPKIKNRSIGVKILPIEGEAAAN